MTRGGKRGRVKQEKRTEVRETKAGKTPERDPLGVPSAAAEASGPEEPLSRRKRETPNFAATQIRDITAEDPWTLTRGGKRGRVKLNLSGYIYDDGDFYTSGNFLYSRKALIRWARYAPAARRRSDDDLTSHIIQRYESSVITQAALCSEAVAELKARCEPAVEYEADVLYLPEGTGIGDTVYVVDSRKELYIPLTRGGKRGRVKLKVYARGKYKYDGRKR